MDLKSLSKLLSYLLRHHPEDLGLSMDPQGWVSVPQLLEALKTQKGLDVSLDQLAQTVAENSKQRFSLDGETQRIRARQGHSIPIDLALEPKVPPSVLFHGTAQAFCAAIAREGLKPMSRQWVHMSRDIPTALEVGRRHGKAWVWQVDCQQMIHQGKLFYQAENLVWLTAAVEPEFLTLMEEGL